MVVISRLVRIKGVDLLLDIIPDLCFSHPKLDFLIAGDGELTPLIEDMMAKYNLKD